MTNIENIDDENNENNHCDSKFEPTIVPTSISVPNGQQTQTCVLQQTTTAISYHRNGHSRNPSSINGITIAQVMQPPLNKPDTIDSLLKLIRFRDSYNDGYENCADIDVKKQRQICGIREARLIMISILILVFLISGTVFFVMWFTEYYNDSIVSSLVLRKNSTALEYFIKPPLNPQLRVHIFNYTNVDEYLAGKHDKLIVKDIGPLVYTERTEKVDVHYNDNNTISYRESRSFEFRKDISKAGQSDTVVVPNIPFLTAAWKLNQNRGMSFLEEMTIKAYHFTSKPFLTVKANSFLWGYDDTLYDLSRKVSSLPTPEKFGILASRNGVSVESFTINSGVDDIRKLNVIDNFNGEPHMNFWSTKECNRVDGTDGAQFPPHLMDQKQPLEVFIKAFCRKFPMHFDSEVSLFNGVPAWRYKAPKNVFDSPDKNPANQCYCPIESDKCAPSGIFNATLCFNAPIYSSFPHFLYGDESLFEHIEGLEPNESEHLTYADIHPRLAFPMAGSSRFQINIQVDKSANALKDFKSDIILPIIWMEVTSSEVPDELRAMIYHSTFSANAIQLSLRYGSLFGLAVSMAILVAGCYLSNSDNESNRRKHEVEEVVTINMDVTKVQTADQSSETEHIKITKMSS